jgi:hypothetical protein
MRNSEVCVPEMNWLLVCLELALLHPSSHADHPDVMSQFAPVGAIFSLFDIGLQGFPVFPRLLIRLVAFHWPYSWSRPYQNIKV